MELTLTFYEDELSKDLAHINSFESISSNNNNILVIGNSLTREGIDGQLIKHSIDDRIISNKEIGYIYPDDTSIIEWYYILTSYHAQSRIYPINIFVIFAKDQLVSAKMQFEEIQRISRYVEFQDLFNIIINERLSLSQSIDLYLSKVFRFYSNKERINKRILDIMPNYRTTFRKLNQKLKPKEIKKEDEKNYYHLNRLISLIDSLKIQTKFIAIPIFKSYNIDPKLKRIINNSKYCELVNFQNIKKFTENDFLDGYHLNQNGARKFTDEFLEYLLSKE